MAWPFSLFRAQPRSEGGTIEAIYGAIVTQARAPMFYAELGVPNTVDGRFDMVVLHLWLVLRRLKRADDPQAISQPLIETFCSDMDNNLRELGVGDLAVPKRVVKFGEALYGRAQAYDAALANPDVTALDVALARNIYGSEASDEARRLAAYVRAADATPVSDATIATFPTKI